MSDAARMPGPMTAQSALREAVLRLEQAGVEGAWLDARLLLMAALHATREDLVATPACELLPYEWQRLDEMLQKREKKMPVAYILGTKEFWGLDFLVSQATLIPRPDSETLIETARSIFSGSAGPQTILDLGTGSGCLAVSALKTFPEAKGCAVDNSDEALAIAARNAQAHGVSSRLQLIKSNWGSGVDRPFDLVLCNPPYIAGTDAGALAEDVVAYEPEGALFAGEDGLAAYAEILADLPRLMTAKGYALFELGKGQAPQVIALSRAQELKIQGIYKDLAGIERCIAFYK